ncbi:hypothetical protein [Kibdelosporangium philippinense]|uniref:hypothetical protein n=1 Tax=Kibdelosporangium philippinense TaxID=211113 RepID=UPI003621E99A
MRRRPVFISFSPTWGKTTNSGNVALAWHGVFADRVTMGRGFLYPWLMALRDTGREQEEQPQGGAGPATRGMFVADWFAAM